MLNAKREPVAIDLALQGGGSHGALTWGVLDRLLEEDWLVIIGRLPWTSRYCPADLSPHTSHP